MPARDNARTGLLARGGPCVRLTDADPDNYPDWPVYVVACAFAVSECRPVPVDIQVVPTGKARPAVTYGEGA